jgi:UrcA family protein
MIRCSRLLPASIPLWIALASLASFPAAQADTRPEKKRLVASVPVTYADLDLNRPADARVLLQRIKQAAYRACGGDPRRHTSYTIIPRRVEMAFRECREDAVAHAITTIHTPALSQANVTIPTM